MNANLQESCARTGSDRRSMTVLAGGDRTPPRARYAVPVSPDDFCPRCDVREPADCVRCVCGGAE